ncbi:hypothetical protein SAMN05444162_3051 [Paenibacillaceae bacterium GAS479]|nr:hypothetical protein SAMN05444162_3051 [Paenibacillaceae bacterium GAS479]
MHPYINQMIKTGGKNKVQHQMKKKDLIEQLKAKAQNADRKSPIDQNIRNQDSLEGKQEDNRGLKKHIKNLENKMSGQEQKLQAFRAKSSKVEIENKALRSNLYEVSTELNNEKKASLDRQSQLDKLTQKCKDLEETNAAQSVQMEKLKQELSRVQSLANSNGPYKLRDSLHRLQKENQALLRELQIEREFRMDQDQLSLLKHTIRTQAANLQQLKNSNSGMISEASIQELFDALRTRLVLAKPSHRAMLLDLYNRLKRIKSRFHEAPGFGQPSSSKEMYGYIIKTGKDLHFYNLENGVYKVCPGEGVYEPDLPVKVKMIHEHEVSIVKQYSYHFVPSTSISVRVRQKIQLTENTIVPIHSTGIRVLVIGSRNRSKYTKLLKECGFYVDWYDGYEESPEALKSKRNNVQVVIICTGHSPHFVYDLFEPDDPRVEKVYRENANSIYHRIRYNGIRQGLL